MNMRVGHRPSYLYPLDINLDIGPVRAVAIHPSRALLATGGDDYKIKVWGEHMSP